MTSKQTTRKPLWKKLIIAVAVLALVCLVAFAGYFIYSYFNSLPFSKQAYNEAKSTGDFRLREQSSYLELAPNQPNSRGLIVYPGAFAQPQAYVATLAPLGSAGTSVYILKSPLNFALLDSGAAARIISAKPNISQWYVAGHSLGGVAACEFAKSNPSRISGLILLASFCNGNANTLKIPVLSITATDDGLTDQKDVAASKPNLPPSTEFVIIEGGNHTQFGYFSKLQPGDRPATIDQALQARQIGEAIANFINR